MAARLRIGSRSLPRFGPSAVFDGGWGYAGWLGLGYPSRRRIRRSRRALFKSADEDGAGSPSVDRAVSPRLMWPEPQSAMSDSRRSHADNPFLDLLGEVRPLIDDQLCSLLSSEQSVHARLGSDVATILERTHAVTLQGKRLRAALIVAGQRALSPKPAALDATVLALGSAIELLQAYFLVHDDWMDQDETRRGVPAVHAALARDFESTHAGACGAVLAGDYLVTLALKTFSGAALAHPAREQLFEQFVRLQLAAVLGQQLDVIGRTRDVTQIYRLKTGSYTVSGPLKLGALLAGADAARLRGLDEFAQPVGLAFQIRDDLLSLFADPEQTGKPFGGDLRAGKKTWLAQHAFEHAAGAERDALSAAFGRREASDAELRQAVEALEACGTRAAAERHIAELCRSARSALDALALPAQGQQLLQGAITAFAEREA